MRVLVVANRRPDAEGRGDAKVARHVEEALREGGHDITVMHAERGWSWQRALCTAAVAPFTRRPLQLLLTSSSRLRQRIAGENANFDILIAVHARAAQHVPAALRDRTLALIVDSYGRAYQTYRGKVPAALDAVYRAEARRMTRYESELCGSFAMVGVVSREDARHLRARAATPRRVVHLPYAVDVDRFSSLPHVAPADPTFAFIGRLGYLPNRLAAETLMTTIWPLLQARWPRARLVIAGRDPSPSLRRTARSRGVELLGDVPDVRPILARSSAVLVPMATGGGVQTKLLEAMAAGVPVVCTSFATLGLEPGGRDHVLQAETPEAFRRQVERLLEQPAFATHLAAGAQRWVRERHSR
ncbi:MAG TPA: glycosyltransferase, partial [Candidatus Sulfotelmatobacter sp.]|nr:glycosyltransferase [Candidatus Sulfotelmatobacter sp.]